MCRLKVLAVAAVVVEAMANVVVGVEVEVVEEVEVEVEVGARRVLSATGMERKVLVSSLLTVATKTCLYTSHPCLVATSVEVIVLCRLVTA